MYFDTCAYFLCAQFADTFAEDGREYCSRHAHEVNAAEHTLALLAV